MEEFELDQCPACDSAEIRHKRGVVMHGRKGIDVRVPRATYWQCGKCEERFCYSGGSCGGLRSTSTNIWAIERRRRSPSDPPRFNPAFSKIGIMSLNPARENGTGASFPPMFAVLRNDAP